MNCFDKYVNMLHSKNSRYLFLALDQTTAGGMEPKAVAADILSAIERRIEDLVIADLKSNIGIVLNTLFPSLFYRLMKRRARKEKESNEKND